MYNLVKPSIYLCRWRGCWWCLSRFARKKGTTSAPASSFACYKLNTTLANIPWLLQLGTTLAQSPRPPSCLADRGWSKAPFDWGLCFTLYHQASYPSAPQGAPPKQSFPPPKNYPPRTRPPIISLRDITLFGASLLKVAPIIIKSTSIFIIIGSSSLLAPCLRFLLATPARPIGLPIEDEAKPL